MRMPWSSPPLSLTLGLALALACTLAAGCASDEAANASAAVGTEPAAPEQAPAPSSAPGAKPAPLPKLSTRDAPPPSDIRGIDVSHYSGEVDWDAVREAGVHFAYIKATEGVDDADPSFASHWARLENDPSILRGAYHFYVTEDDPEEQARFFLSNVKMKPGDLPPVVDVEMLGHGTEPGLADRLETFLKIVEQGAGVRPIIYTAPKFWNAHLTDRFGDYPLWVAEYQVDEPVTPEGWEGWMLWQWEQDVDIPGVEKGADLSHLHPDMDLEGMRLPKVP